VLGRTRGMLSEHAHRRESAEIQLAGAKDEAVVEIGPDGVLFRRAFMRRHGLRTRRSECDIDGTRNHQADDLLQTLLNVGVGDVGEDIGIFPGKLRLAKALHFRVAGETNEVLVRVDDHIRGKLKSFLFPGGILEKLRDCVDLQAACLEFCTAAQQTRSCKRPRPSAAISFRRQNHRTDAARHPTGSAQSTIGFHPPGRA